MNWEITSYKLSATFQSTAFKLYIVRFTKRSEWGNIAITVPLYAKKPVHFRLGVMQYNRFPAEYENKYFVFATENGLVTLASANQEGA